MAILVISADLKCCRCKEKLCKILASLREMYCIEKTEYEETKVIVRGNFPAERLRAAIWCKAAGGGGGNCKLITDIAVVDEYPPKKKEEEKKKDPEKPPPKLECNLQVPPPFPWPPYPYLPRCYYPMQPPCQSSSTVTWQCHCCPKPKPPPTPPEPEPEPETTKIKKTCERDCERDHCHGGDCGDWCRRPPINCPSPPPLPPPACQHHQVWPPPPPRGGCKVVCRQDENVCSVM